MLATIDLRGVPTTSPEFSGAVPRARVDISVASQAAAALIDEVRKRGSEALFAQAERFDRVRPETLRVPASAIDEAVEALDPDVREALTEAISRVHRASSAQVPPEVTTELGPGATVTQRWEPITRAGLYVPGGKAVYPSSVVMNVVPAQVAGVREIVIATPAQADHGGSAHPVVLAAAALLGVDEVWIIGGAGAIGALAYGVPDAGLAPVQIITGPGNIYVAAAKRLVRGQVSIDAEAGTTEILVIADESANPRLVASDLLSQAEHDEAAASVLVTASAAHAARVEAELDRLLAVTGNRERAGAALSGPQSAIVLVDDELAACAFSNLYAPEHLELHTADTEATLALITNAGAIFIGPHSPVSLGDYMAGSNHVLPTGGTARFSAALGASSFLRPQQIVRYDRAALAEVSERIVTLAQAEELPAHAEAITARFAEAPVDEPGTSTANQSASLVTEPDEGHTARADDSSVRGDMYLAANH